ncbi:MAG: glycoside hydrolase family 65 protein, partial [Armatimonadetes bacterium]|nr:glycoside hydrolase family 65 protein [Armatimonadota bacterium]
MLHLSGAAPGVPTVRVRGVAPVSYRKDVRRRSGRRGDHAPLRRGAPEIVGRVVRRIQPGAWKQLARLLPGLCLLGSCRDAADRPAGPPASASLPRGEAPLHLSPDPWVLTTESWDVPGGFRGAYLGNGWLGQRLGRTGVGISPELKEPMLLAGHYNPDDSLEALPTALPLELRVGTQVFGTDPKAVRQYQQELRLKEGLLVTRATWDGGAGEVEVEWEAAFLRHQPDVALLRGRVQNRGRVPVAAVLAEAALAPGSTRDPEGNFEGNSGKIRLAGRLTAWDSVERGAQGQAGFQVAGGQTARFALATRVSGSPLPLPNALSSPPEPTEARTEVWLKEHRAAWARLWRRDIQIDGDPEAQQVVRACLFYLLASIRPENVAGVPPMGLSSQAFSGHVFWDMDSWIFPALLPQHPELARAMLEYRYRSLPGARANAEADGLPGASFAWESGRTGREALKNAVFSHGRHVTGDVALALGQYYQATQDRAWLAERGWPILKETAVNWVARAKPAGRGRLQIPQVTTPDENAGRVDGSAWTHHVARHNLMLATETAGTLRQAADPRWKKTAEELAFLRDPASNRILAHARFTEKSKAKQADALLLFHPGGLTLPEAEWNDLYDFYAARVIPNGPAMTDAIHAVVAARLGKAQEAESRFRSAYRPFLRPPYHLFSEKRTR